MHPGLAKGGFLNYNAPVKQFCTGKPAWIEPDGMTSGGHDIEWITH